MQLRPALAQPGTRRSAGLSWSSNSAAKIYAMITVIRGMIHVQFRVQGFKAVTIPAPGAGYKGIV